jgi:hypothetical protein
MSTTPATSSPWFGYPPATTWIECGGDRHRLRWRDGELLALDHEDPEGDRTLAALGGESYECLAALDTWSRHREDLRVLVLATRGRSDLVRPADGNDQHAGAPFGSLVQRGSGAGWFAYAPVAGPPPAMPRQALMGGRALSFVSSGGAGAAAPEAARALLGAASLASLGGGVARRLCATIAATWAERLAAGDPQALRRRAGLHAALHGRVVTAVREWLDDPQADVEVDMIDAGAERNVRRDEDGRVVVRVPPTWLHEVWGREVEVTAATFVLGARTSDGALLLDAVALDGAEAMLSIATTPR